MSGDASGAKDILGTFSKDRTELLELLVAERSGDTDEIRPYPRDQSLDELGLTTSAAQQRLWMIDLEGGGAAYNVPLAVRLKGTLDQPALDRSLQTLVQRHEVLRTVFANVEGEPRQRVIPEMDFSLQRIDLGDYQGAEREVRVCAHKAQELHEHFDLTRGPLIRGRLLRLSADEHVLLITMHHIVCDAWSMGIFARELAQLYGDYRAGLVPDLRPLPIQYADFAHWQRQWLLGGRVQLQMSYWRSRLLDAPSQLELPTDRTRPAVQSYRGANVSGHLGVELSAELRVFARRYGMTMFMVSYAACALLLSRLSGQEDVLIGAPVANRRQRELEGLIGFFVNTLVLRVRVQDNLQVQEFLQEVRKVMLEAYDHQDMPFEQLVEVLKPQRDPGRNPFFQVMLVVQNAHDGELRLPGLVATTEESAVEAAKFDLVLFLEERGDDIEFRINYATDLFDKETIERWMACFNFLLAAMLRGDRGRVSELPILPASQLATIDAFNATQTSHAPCRLVHTLFEEQVRQSPAGIAVVHGSRHLTYADLNCKANQLARYLGSRKVGSGQLVGICVERTLEMVVGLLGILKAGGAYLPLDPNYPLERLQHMLEDSAPQVVLTQSSLLAQLPATRADFIALDEQLLQCANEDGEDVPTGCEASNAEHPVYVIYTSGSTGKPKGTAMPHRSMVNLIEWQRAALPADVGCRVLQFAALSFDVAFQEVFTTLCTGGTLVLLDEWIRRDAAAVTELLTSYSIRRLFVPPLMLQSLAEYATTASAPPVSLCDVITAGEQLRISPEIRSLFGQLPDCRLHNHYGPTETHVVTALTLVGDSSQWPLLPSIGRPIANTQIHVLDGQRQRVPIGVVGEIYIGGTCVALGYLGRPELTSQRFITDPFSTDPPAILYKTGDLGRWRIDGTIEYLGRSDDQVKLRGYRIELGEIEAQLSQHELVKEAAVVAREDVRGDKRLVAYMTRLGESGPSVEELRAYLKGRLPDYMVPSAFVILESLPLTPSGKLDRRSLPAPEIEAYAGTPYEPLVGEVEETLARIWQELLHVDRVGRKDNFFELGGHSLLSVKALFKINQSFGGMLRVTDLYKNPTLQDLAARVRGSRTEDELIDLSKEAALDETIVAAAGLPRAHPKAVLLTGGTGFVGRFLLAHLLQHTDATIFCLVRAASEQQARLRLQAMLLEWDLWSPEFEDRIVAIPGDLRLRRLGISDASYQNLAREIDSIYHCATSMNHLETYAMAKLANVDAAKELLALATCQRPKLVNYVSTLAVFNARAPDRSVYEKTDIEREIHFASEGYVASKWVGEKIFMTAGERGIPCNIFRVGLVWPDTQRGRYDELQHGYRIVKSCLLSGYAIEDYRSQMAPTPVDYVARAIVALATKHCEGGGLFHISSPGRKISGLFERCNEIAGTSLILLPFYDWICEIKRLHHEGHSLPAVPLLEFAFTMDREAFEAQQRAKLTVGIRFDCTETYRELEQDGIVAPELDDELLKASLESMLSRDAELRELSLRMHRPNVLTA